MQEFQSFRVSEFQSFRFLELKLSAFSCQLSLKTKDLHNLRIPGLSQFVITSFHSSVVSWNINPSGNSFKTSQPFNPSTLHPFPLSPLLSSAFLKYITESADIIAS